MKFLALLGAIWISIWLGTYGAIKIFVVPPQPNEIFIRNEHQSRFLLLMLFPGRVAGLP
jgi:hypothetical protein